MSGVFPVRNHAKTHLWVSKPFILLHTQKPKYARVQQWREEVIKATEEN